MKKQTKIFSGMLIAMLMLSMLTVTAFAAPETTAPTETVPEEIIEPIPTEVTEPAVQPETTAPQETIPPEALPGSFSGDSEFFTRDLLYDKATNKQFITVQDREGNVFYIVIDYDAPVDEGEEQYKTYFLNAVDGEDLNALAEKKGKKPVACICTEKCEPGEINMNCPVCSKNVSECAGTEPTLPEEETTEPSKQESQDQGQSGNMNFAVLGGLLLLVGGGAFAIVKFGKGKKSGTKHGSDYDYEDEYEDSIMEKEDSESPESEDE